MKKNSLLLLSFTCCILVTLSLSKGYAQNVGIGTTTPGSKLQVAGSFAPNYTVVTTSPYTVGANDYYVLFQGGFSAGVFRLPAGAAALKGRNYFIKNGAANPLTIKAAANETIDGDTAVILSPGEVVHMVMKGTAGSGVSTSEVVSVTQGSYSFFNAGLPGRPWNTIGNSGTDPVKNFIGTTDHQDFVTRTYGIERMRVTKDGAVGIGTPAPIATVHVESPGNPVAGFFTTSAYSNYDSGVLRVEYTGSAPAGRTAVMGRSTLGAGMLGAGTTSGVEGYAYPDNGSYINAGVRGECTGQTGINYGIVGVAKQYFGLPDAGTKIGIYGTASGGSVNYAGLFDGELRVNGLIYSPTGLTVDGPGVIGNGLSVFGNFTATGTKAFLIDHPLDPENKYLYHYCTESNEALNVYSGNVTTDANGLAVVQLPSYFQSINKDFRYQLTTIGPLTQASVKSEIENNSFSIQTGLPNIKVSWQVTAVRNDKYMQQHPAKDEVEKEAANKGKYLQPADWQQPETKGINYSKPVTVGKM